MGKGTSTIFIQRGGDGYHTTRTRRYPLTSLTKTGKMINGKTLQNMKIIMKFSPNEKDLKESTAPTKLMTDFPPIYQERNSEALAKLVVEYAKDSSIRMVSGVSAAATEAPSPSQKEETCF